jgi:hypothetical protein
MTSLSAFLLAMITPMLGRILTALGFAVVSVVGFDIAITTLKNLFLLHVGAVPAAGLQMALLAGAGQAMGIIFGAITTRLLLWKASQVTRILGVNT